MGIKDNLDKMFAVDDAKIGKMASVDIATGGILPLPNKNESVTIRIVGTPKLVQNDKIANKNGAVSIRCVIFGKEQDLQYDLWLASTIYKGVLAAFKKTNTPVDNDLQCLNGRIITIVGKDWHSAPKEMWKIDDVTKKPISPKTYGVALRTEMPEKIEEFIEDASNIRSEIKGIENYVLDFKKNVMEGRVPLADVSDNGEILANITLAYRHLEDARMRIGKAIQSFDGGVSVYNR